ncbi:MAG: transaldolase [Dongiaceae bacterium]
MNVTPSLDRLRIKLFADGADLAGIRAMSEKPYIRGFTTNPTLMRRAGVTDYRAFAAAVLEAVPDRPISFEVFADEFDEMERQAIEIASWGANVNVKIPVTNTEGVSSAPLVARLSRRGVQVNVTAMFTLEQVRDIVEALAPGAPAILSIFAGRIADTGRDPMPLMREAVAIARARPLAEVLWASPRELLNVIHADACGCHIITATNDLLDKLGGLDKDLDRFSRETVAMFHRDALIAGFSIGTRTSVEA